MQNHSPNKAITKPNIISPLCSNLPVLYSFRRCPYAMRARLAIKASRVEVILREIILRNKPAHMLEQSPKGTVPVLIFANGTVIDESLDIAKWALAQNDPQNLLSPKTATQEQLFSLIAENDGPFKHHLDRTKYAVRYPDENKEDHQEKASVFLFKLNGQLENKGFLFGEHRSLPDITIAPFVRQFANIDRPWFDKQNWPHLLRWLNEFLESELFISVMEKYKPWQEGDSPLYFPETKSEQA